MIKKCSFQFYFVQNNSKTRVVTIGLVNEIFYHYPFDYLCWWKILTKNFLWKLISVYIYLSKLIWDWLKSKSNMIKFIRYSRVRSFDLAKKIAEFLKKCLLAWLFVASAIVSEFGLLFSSVSKFFKFFCFILSNVSISSYSPTTTTKFKNQKMWMGSCNFTNNRFFGQDQDVISISNIFC